MEEMDQPACSLDSNSARTGSTHASNKKKYNHMGGQRIVVAVKIQGNGKKLRNGGSPSDCWSWRKYGQKPIKGSPYPRGYYRCSTSKNCSAKKQVERCKTDATTLIITYTCAHNHPEPDNPSSNQKQEPEPKQEQEPAEYKHEQETPIPNINNNNNNIDQADHFQCSKFTFNSPLDHLVEENPFAETTSVLIYNEDFRRSSLPVNFSELKSEENDFFDELEELPTSSFFTALMTSDFCDRRILLNPS